MFFSTHRSLFLNSTLFAFAFVRAFAGPSLAVETGEAQRLYERANDYVSRITEHGYSYAYLQFYWKRAESNVERVIRDYPQSSIGHQLRANQLKLGPYELAYFRERVLPRLEDKKTAAFEDVNCAIFLYNLRDNNDPQRLAALSRIIEVLARRMRWSEALIFPVLRENHPVLLASIFRVAARFDQTKVINDLLKTAAPDGRAALWPILGEAMAVRGEARNEIAKFLDAHSSDEVKLGVLSGMIEREVKIQRTAALRLPEKNISLPDAALKNTNVRDDIDTVAATFFPIPTTASTKALAAYHAALGQKPPFQGPTEAHLAYLEYLAAFEKFDELARYLPLNELPAEARHSGELKLIELYTQAGRLKEADAIRTLSSPADPAFADLAALAQFRGAITSTAFPLRIHSNTFATLPIKDPCILAQAILEWSLAPTDIERRGAAPWDAVVQEFLPGFEQLPLPKSKDVQAAASSQKPY